MKNLNWLMNLDEWIGPLKLEQENTNERIETNGRETKNNKDCDRRKKYINREREREKIKTKKNEKIHWETKKNEIKTEKKTENLNKRK